MADNPLDKGSLDELGESAKKILSPIEQVLDAIGSMYNEADKLNNAFLQGRNRLDEMNDAVAKAASGVIRLGGNISDVSNTMMGIAEGARRNVIATEDQVSKLFAASRILETNSETLVENFAEVGYEVSQIGVNLEGSIEYVQSVGLNAKTVVSDVTRNMELMNRFNFNEGVQGLTKMAAQASMLRFDMNATKNFAEKVLTPEGAINTAAALQRLGVAVGQLGDPFALMNDSINDPGALQDSLINATKQFTQFDEKSKSFKINPQGILTLREMAAETGISYEQLTKTALAAADLDKRISMISPSLQFESEEDKQFLANMATMDKSGEYIVQLKDDKTGIVEQRKLSDITQDELTKLREQQANAPKTLEEIQTSQLDVIKNIQSLVESIVARGAYGVAGTSFVRGNIVGGERITRAMTSSVEEQLPTTSEITRGLNSTINKMSELFTQKGEGKISDTAFTEKLGRLEEDVMSKVNSYGQKGIDALKNVVEDTGKKITGTSGIEKQFKDFINKELYSDALTTKMSATPKTSKTVEPLSRDRFFGAQPKTQNITKTTQLNSQVDFGGTITIKVDAPPGVSEQQFKTFFESEEFKKKIYEYYNQKAKELERK